MAIYLNYDFENNDLINCVTGHCKYTTDIFFENMLHVKVLRSPYPSARIRNINLEKAKSLPGVRAILTGKELSSYLYGIFIEDQPILAYENIRYIGEPIAAVAASDENMAKEACELIEVDYEPMSELIDPIIAKKSDILIHPELKFYRTTNPYNMDGNICTMLELQYGNLNDARKKSHEIFTHNFKTGMVHQCPLEPHATVVVLGNSGDLLVYTGQQLPFVLRDTLHKLLKIPMSKIRVCTPRIGGAFGGKMGAQLEPICALFAIKTKQPVKMVLTREEEFIDGRPRHPSSITLSTGITRKGKILFREAEVVYDAGAYAITSPAVLSNAVLRVSGPYDISNVYVKGYAVYTNTVPTGGFRGYGSPQVHFASEVQINAIAKEMGFDPIELREKNLVKKGSKSTSGQVMHSVGLKDTLNIIKENMHNGTSNKTASSFIQIGEGVACAYHSTGKYSSGAIAILQQDGSLTIINGAPEFGQGVSTVISTVVKNILGCNFSKINVVNADTAIAPWDGGSIASRLSFSVASAAQNACLDLKEHILNLVNTQLETNIQNLKLSDAGVEVQYNGEEKLLSYSSILAGKGSLIGTGSYEVKGTVEKQRFKGGPLGPVGSFSFATHCAEVSIDIETGKINVRKVLAAHDVGKAFNKDNVEDQINGGVVMGQGYATTEQTVFRNGKIINANLHDYKIPLSTDIPEINSFIVESLDSVGPFGAKAVGEICLVPTAPAIVNAIHHATGVLLTEIPIKPEDLLKAIKKKVTSQA